MTHLANRSSPACASACASALLVACASAPHSAPTGRAPQIEPLFDAAVEWTERGAPAAIAPRKSVAPVVVAEPWPELRPFSEPELRRIHGVQREVLRAARVTRIPPELINGIIWVESRFVVDARGERGPLGLMQLMPRTGLALADELGRPYAPFDPAFNIAAGTRYFAQMLERFSGNLRLSLAAYNIGPSVVRDWVQRQEPLPERSVRYIEDVFTAARAFRARAL